MAPFAFLNLADNTVYINFNTGTLKVTHKLSALPSVALTVSFDILGCISSSVGSSLDFTGSIFDWVVSHFVLCPGNHLCLIHK